MTPGQRVEALYLAALGRPPTDRESERMLRHAAAPRAAEGLADIFWVLLNSAEFRLNH